MKNVLHPALQRKQILEGVLKSLWQSHLKIAKISTDKAGKKLEVDEKKQSEMNDVERAKLADQEKKNVAANQERED